MGSLHNVDFGVFWVSWGGSGKEPGSGNRFGNRRWFHSMGSNRFLAAVFKVWFLRFWSSAS